MAAKKTKKPASKKPAATASRKPAKAASKKKPAKATAGRGAPAKAKAAKAPRAKAAPKARGGAAPKPAKATKAKAAPAKAAPAKATTRGPAFDARGFDRTTFAPFVLHDCRSTQWADVRLTCDDWAAVHAVAGGESPDGYYLNGYGLEGLVKAAMLGAGLDPEAEGVHGNSEGDTCNLHFKDLEAAVGAATAAAEMLASRAALAGAVAVARERGFED